MRAPRGTSYSATPMSSPFLDRLAQGPLLADGAMGTLLYQHGASFADSFDGLNLTNPSLIESIHREYLVAGARLIETNTFGANAIRLTPHGLQENVRRIARQGVKVARSAREIVGVDAFVAGSIGPLGKPLQPFGQITATEAEAYFRATAEGLLEGGCDCFILETFQDLTEILSALRQQKVATPVLLLTAKDTVEDRVRGLDAGAHHVVNAGLHALATLFLFAALVRLTNASAAAAFAAGLFAAHPLHVESVAWIAERKDVLSGFFALLAICLGLALHVRFATRILERKAGLQPNCTHCDYSWGGSRIVGHTSQTG